MTKESQWEVLSEWRDDVVIAHFSNMRADKIVQFTVNRYGDIFKCEMHSE